MVQWEWRQNSLWLRVGYHEWAWSQRTSQRSIYAVDKQGEIHYIGGTSKRPAVYELPPDTLAVIRTYITNGGFWRFYVYIPNQDSYIPVEEEHDFRLPQGLQPEVVRAIERMVNEVTRKGHLFDLITPTPMEGEL